MCYDYINEHNYHIFSSVKLSRNLFIIINIPQQNQQQFNHLTLYNYENEASFTCPLIYDIINVLFKKNVYMKRRFLSVGVSSWINMSDTLEKEAHSIVVVYFNAFYFIVFNPLTRAKG